MQIQIDDNTKNYIQSKGKPISVKTLQVSSCCAPPIQELMTYFGKPKDVHNYKELKLDNVSIFIEKHLSSNEKMTLKLSGIGIFKSISAKFS